MGNSRIANIGGGPQQQPQLHQPQQQQGQPQQGQQQQGHPQQGQQQQGHPQPGHAPVFPAQPQPQPQPQPQQQGQGAAPQQQPAGLIVPAQPAVLGNPAPVPRPAGQFWQMGQAIGPAGPGALPQIHYGMFETKPYDVRLNDALTWTLRHEDTDLGLYTALRNWRRYASEDDQRYLSHLMSQSGLGRRFAHDRESARAILLMAAIEHPNDRARWQQAAGDVEAGRLDLYAARARARQAYNARHNTQQNLEAARDSLRTDPVRFLSDYPLSISSAPGRDGHPYRLVMIDGTYRLTNGTHAVQGVAIHGDTIPALPARHLDPQNEALVGTPATGDMTLTTQFSGCAYVFQTSVDKQHLVATHRNPGMNDARELEGGRSGAELARDLRAHAHFDNPPPDPVPIRVYGRLDAADPAGSYGYRDGYVTIVAIKDEHQRWQVYAQNRLPDHSLVVEHLNPPP